MATPPRVKHSGSQVPHKVRGILSDPRSENARSAYKLKPVSRPGNKHLDHRNLMTIRVCTRFNEKRGVRFTVNVEALLRGQNPRRSSVVFKHHSTGLSRPRREAKKLTPVRGFDKLQR